MARGIRRGGSPVKYHILPHEHVPGKPLLNTFIDAQYRRASFDWLNDQVAIHGDVLPWELLQKGFEFSGRRITLVGPQGIWKPAVFPEIPLSIMTRLDGPYNDSFSKDGYLLYRYQGSNPDQWDNAGLRKAWKEQVPLIYFYNISRGYYLAVWPVYIVDDDVRNLTFTVAADDARMIDLSIRPVDASRIQDAAVEQIRRSYITSTVKVRLHQTAFRERVLAAYREQCALCRLRHRELLDAAHIIPDSDPLGEPAVRNGLALCKLHHAAFDGHFIGIRPDYTVEVRKDILKEKDGPMLLHGLQGIHHSTLNLPRDSGDRPDPGYLEMRYKLFQAAG